MATVALPAALDERAGRTRFDRFLLRGRGDDRQPADGGQAQRDAIEHRVAGAAAKKELVHRLASGTGRRILFMFEALAVQAEPIFLAFEYAQ